jgi:hypothetical protein
MAVSVSERKHAEFCSVLLRALNPGDLTVTLGQQQGLIYTVGRFCIVLNHDETFNLQVDAL